MAEEEYLEYISLSSVVRERSVTFCMCTRSSQRANDVKIVPVGMRNSILSTPDTEAACLRRLERVFRCTGARNVHKP